MAYGFSNFTRSGGDGSDRRQQTRDRRAGYLLEHVDAIGAILHQRVLIAHQELGDVVGRDGLRGMLTRSIGPVSFISAAIVYTSIANTPSTWWPLYAG